MTVILTDFDMNGSQMKRLPAAVAVPVTKLRTKRRPANNIHDSLFMAAGDVVSWTLLDYALLLM